MSVEDKGIEIMKEIQVANVTSILSVSLTSVGDDFWNKYRGKKVGDCKVYCPNVPSNNVGCR